MFHGHFSSMLRCLNREQRHDTLKSLARALDYAEQAKRRDYRQLYLLIAKGLGELSTIQRRRLERDT